MSAFIGLGGGGFGLLFTIFALSALVLPVIALVDIVRSDFRGSNDKLIWVLIVLFFNIIGALLYFFIGRNQRIA